MILLPQLWTNKELRAFHC